MTRHVLGPEIMIGLIVIVRIVVSTTVIIIFLASGIDNERLLGTDGIETA